MIKLKSLEGKQTNSYRMNFELLGPSFPWILEKNISPDSARALPLVKSTAFEMNSDSYLQNDHLIGNKSDKLNLTIISESKTDLKEKNI